MENKAEAGKTAILLCNKLQEAIAQEPQNDQHYKDLESALCLLSRNIRFVQGEVADTGRILLEGWRRLARREPDDDQ